MNIIQGVQQIRYFIHRVKNQNLTCDTVEAVVTVTGEAATGPVSDDSVDFLDLQHHLQRVKRMIQSKMRTTGTAGTI